MNIIQNEDTVTIPMNNVEIIMPLDMFKKIDKKHLIIQNGDTVTIQMNNVEIIMPLDMFKKIDKKHLEEMSIDCSL